MCFSCARCGLTRFSSGAIGIFHLSPAFCLQLNRCTKTRSWTPRRTTRAASPNEAFFGRREHATPRWRRDVRQLSESRVAEVDGLRRAEPGHARMPVASRARGAPKRPLRGRHRRFFRAEAEGAL